MTIIYTNQRSRKRKPTAKQRELAREWQELIAKYAPKSKTLGEIKALSSLQPKPYRRETPDYPSLNSTEYNTYKKNVMQYTGDKMKGIGTLHKSNAVPIFTDEEAKDQANMRR
jgi:hypothetical protein